MVSSRLPAIASALLLPAAALACSGPGAAEFIAFNERVGVYGFLATLAVVGGALFGMRRAELGSRWDAALIALVVVHPGWWMSARGGDCGMTLRYASLAATFVAIGIVGTVVIRRVKGRASEGE